MKERPSGKILASVAAERDVDITDLPSLNNRIDVDSFDRLVESSDGIALSFRYAGCLVSVRSGETLHISVESLAQLA